MGRANPTAHSGVLTASALGVTGSTGAPNPGRFMGVTSTGAPTAGTFAVNDYVLTQNGQMFVCVTAGTPGTWVSPRDTTELLATGEETYSRDLINTNISMVTQHLTLTYWTARKSETVTQVRTMVDNTGITGTPTLIAIGLYTIDASGAGALVASTASDVTLWVTAQTAYTKAFQASYAKVAGQRYATGLLIVQASGTLPNLVASGRDITPAIRAEMALAPRRVGKLTGQSTLPSTFTDAALAAYSIRPYSVVIP